MSRFDWDKQNKKQQILRQGFESAEAPIPPKDDTPTRKSDLVYGISKAAKAANNRDREELKVLQHRLHLWKAAGDVSPVELDKLSRKISQLNAKLPPEKHPRQKQRRSGKKKRSRRRGMK